MRRAPAWMAAIGVLIGWLAAPAAAQAASVWVTLAAGLPEVVAPTSTSDFFFDNPHAPNIAVNQLTGGMTAEATTGGGSSFFGGAGTPVLLNLADGSAYLASGSPPPGAKTEIAGATAASSAPVAGGSVPSNAALLGVTVAEPDGGTRALTATVTDSAGNVLGNALLTVPEEGWWVLGLTPDPRQPTPDPGPIILPPVDPDPIPEPLPTTSPPPSGGPVATPEPGTLLLAAIGGFAVRAWRRTRPRIASA